MATLTATQITRLRKMTGDTNTSEPDLTDAELQAEYDLAESDMDVAAVYILRLRMGMAAKLTDVSHSEGEGSTSEQRSQRRKAIQDLLAYYEGVTGMFGGGELQAGVISLGLDEDEE